MYVVFLCPFLGILSDNCIQDAFVAYRNLSVDICTYPLYCLLIFFHLISNLSSSSQLISHSSQEISSPPYSSSLPSFVKPQWGSDPASDFSDVSSMSMTTISAGHLIDNDQAASTLKASGQC